VEARRFGKAPPAVARGGDVVPGVAEHGGEEITRGPVVVDDQDPSPTGPSKGPPNGIVGKS